MNNYPNKKSVIETFQRALDQSSFVLKENPELTFPQIYNRLFPEIEKKGLLLEKLESGKNKYSKPWLRILTKPKKTNPLIRTFSGHKGMITDCAFNPKGDIIVSSGMDRQLKIWDVKTAKEISTLGGHNHEVTGCAFSPDGKRIVSSSKDGTVRIWEVGTSREIITIGEASGDQLSEVTFMTCCAFSPDGQYIAAGDSEGKIKLWDADNREMILDFQGHRSWIVQLEFSHDWKQIASASFDNTIKVWDTISGRQIADFKGHRDLSDITNWMSFAFSPDDKWIISSSYDDYKIRIWDSSTGRELYTLFGSFDEHPIWHHDHSGEFIFSGNKEGKITAWRTDDRARNHYEGMEIVTVRGHEKNITSCSISPLGKYLLTGSADTTMKLWDVKKLVDIAGSNYENDLKEHSQTEKLSTQKKHIGDGEEVDQINVEELINNYQLYKGNIGENTSRIYSPDRRLIASASYHLREKKKEIKILDTETGEEILTLEDCTPHRIFSFFFPPGDVDFGVFLQYHRIIKEYLRIVNLSFSPDGNHVIASSGDRTLNIWETNSGREIFSLKGHFFKEFDFAFNPEFEKMVIIEDENHIFALENFKKDPAISSAKKEANNLYYVCPYCQVTNPIEESSLDQEITCTSCGQKNKLNPFTIKLD